MNIKFLMGILLPVIFLSTTTSGQNQPINHEEKLAIAEKSFQLLKANYIFQDKVQPLESAIRKKLSNGDYKEYNTVSLFLKNLNSDLERLSNDRHVNIFYDPVRVKQINRESKTEYAKQSFDPQFLAKAKFENFMVRKIERLEGNVGYLKLDLFLDIRLSKNTLAAAMNFLANSSALIIDLRQNGGGNASTVNFLLNYFLPDSTLTSKFTSRLTNTTTSIYTEPDPLIQKFSPAIPLYILTGKRTSSAAEVFAYTLQAFKRAVIVGDTTNGEANPGYALALNDDMWMMIPTSVNINAITKTNWQGVGVIPDILIPAARSFSAAQAKAHHELSLLTKDTTLKYKYQWQALSFHSKAYPLKADTTGFKALTGNYADNRTITLEGSDLYYQRIGVGKKIKLVQLNAETFELEGAEYFRIKFLKNGLEGLYDDGTVEFSKKLF